MTQRIEKAFLFDAAMVQDVEKQIARLSKRAVKLGQDAIGFEYGEPIAIADDYVVRVGVVSAAAPKVNGFTVIAKIEEDATIGRMINSVPGFEGDLTQYREGKLHCDHCCKPRKRKVHYIVENEAGERRVIGKTCLVDYVGSENVEARLKLWQWISEADGESWGCGGGQAALKLRAVIRWAAASTIKLGYRKTDNVNGSTRNDVSLAMTGAGKIAVAVREDLRQVENAGDEADAAIDWAANLDGDELNGEYMWNLHRIAKSDYVTSKTFGIACSLYQAYLRAMDRVKKFEAAKQEAAKQTCFDGIEGTRYKGQQFKVSRVRGIDGYYGESTLVCFVNEATGEHLTWFASGYKSDWFDAEGDTVVIDFTVKGHDADNQYGATTKVTRVKLVKQLADASC
jgi:hypothetical protein